MGRGRGSNAANAKGGKKAQQQKGRGQQGRGQRGPIQFAKAVRTELKKVNWPDREQLRQSTAVVLIIVTTLGLYVAAWDLVFQNLARLIFA
ncbi:preprotein translocase subunit SecE [Rubrobacter aplysinae]|uniref:preprotein translocase subunit SecE n=1 Tax=Rubrobacter aplysinae TaxID=909625 RepID=UPI00064BB662|nr:preprotein translocase subunit SecE [Rubrobacter aplysinae]